ncbi:hypothetical protein ACLB2K_003372 [Fragaria x ananassa]
MMRLEGTIHGKLIRVFIDCGSASNFLNPDVATQLGIPVHHDSSLRFTSAFGHQLRHFRTVREVTVHIQGYNFTDDLLLLPIEGCDLVLGAKWLNTLCFIGWHFADKVMIFFSNEKCYTLQGTNSGRRTDIASLMALVQSAFSHPTYSTPPKPDPLQNQPKCVLELIHAYADLFSTPTTLPPQRPIDHKITLLPYTSPIRVSPYRYAHSQKGELESLVQEMLEKEIIHPSSSPYSSPVRLVKKKDKPWYFCVDYRRFNAATIKDRFPISVVDELLDELHGACYFTKLDLRSGYHQIRMREEDIEKTAFRTHDGPFEFFVMPFGLTNAPSTFQALMNHIFKPHLPQPKVEYVGHIVTKEGVSMDPQKIQSILDWPKPTTVKGLRGFLGMAGYYRRFI